MPEGITAAPEGKGSDREGAEAGGVSIQISPLLIYSGAQFGYEIGAFE